MQIKRTQILFLGSQIRSEIGYKCPDNWPKDKFERVIGKKEEMKGI